MSGIAYFFVCLALLVAGYAVYGVFVEKVFGADAKRPTPVQTMADGVDFVPMPLWKTYMIQLLNIAGLGPVFGPILGAQYGPAALLWVVLGCIFAGAVHDYVSGMISLRYHGCSYPDIISRNLGNGVRWFTVLFAIVLLVMVGAVFTTGPAAILASITPMSLLLWCSIIFVYYFCATILPIDVLIGRIYPYFAALLVFMAFGLLIAMFSQGMDILPNVTLQSFTVNTNPQGSPIWPGLFIVIACGAISGFHATQSPMMARCMTSERQGRLLFYGAMISEGIIGLIWVTIGLSYYPDAATLAAAGTAPVVVKNVSLGLLGGFGGVLAILGVVILPITSGDTAFRSARMLIGDIFHIDPKPIKNRLLIALPLFAVGIGLTLVDFNVIWRYFGWANQTMAAVCLWACSVYLARRNRFHWVATVPAVFMTACVTTFFCNAKIGLNMPYTPSVYAGIVVAFVLLLLFFWRGHTMPDDAEEKNS